MKAIVLPMILIQGVSWAQVSSETRSCLVAHSENLRAHRISSLLHPRSGKHRMMRQLLQDRVLRNRFYPQNKTSSEQIEVVEETAALSSDSKVTEHFQETESKSSAEGSLQSGHEFNQDTHIDKIVWSDGNHVLVVHESDKWKTQGTSIDMSGKEAQSLRLAFLPKETDESIVTMEPLAGGSEWEYRFLNRITHQDVRPPIHGHSLVSHGEVVSYIPAADPSRQALEYVTGRGGAPIDLDASGFPGWKLNVMGDTPFLVEPQPQAHPNRVAAWSTFSLSFHELEFASTPRLGLGHAFKFSIGHGDRKALVFGVDIFNAMKVFDHQEIHIVKLADLQPGQIHSFAGSDYDRAEKLSDRYGVFKQRNSVFQVLIDFETGEEFPAGPWKMQMLSDHSYATLEEDPRATTHLKEVLRIRKPGSFHVLQKLEFDMKPGFDRQVAEFIPGTDFAKVERSQGSDHVTEIYNILTGKKVWEGRQILQFGISPNQKRIAFIGADRKLYTESLESETRAP